MFFSPAKTVALVLLLELAVSVQLVPSALRKVDWQLLWPLTLGSWVAAPVGIWILLIVDEIVMRRVISGVVLTFVLLWALGWRQQRRQGKLAVGFVGMLSGVFSSATGMGGPPVILFLLSGDHAPNRIRSTIILFFLAAVFPPLTGLFINKVIDAEVGYRLALLAPVFPGFAWIGGLGFNAANIAAYRSVTLALLALIALAVMFI